MGVASELEFHEQPRASSKVGPGPFPAGPSVVPDDHKSSSKTFRPTFMSFALLRLPWVLTPDVLFCDQSIVGAFPIPVLKMQSETGCSPKGLNVALETA